MERDETRQAQGRPVPPALPGRAVLPRRPRRTSATRCASSASRASAARSPTRPRPSTTSSAPTDFDPRAYANRADWQLGDAGRHRRDLDLRADRLADRAPLRPLRRGARRPSDDGGVVFAHRRTPTPRQLIAGCCGLGEHARVLGPPELVARGRASASSCSSSATRGERRSSASAARPRAAEPASPSPRAARRQRPRARPRSARSASRAW